MSEVTATEAARSFGDLLDAVEHRGESFTIVRRGKAIASLAPMTDGHGADVKALLRRHHPDSQWSEDLASTRGAHDLIFAATARAASRKVVSAHEAAFEDLPGVQVQTHH